MIALLVSFLLAPGASAQPVASLMFTQQPKEITAGQVFSTAPAIALLDEQGKVVTTDSSCIVRLSLLSSDEADALEGTQLATAVSGVVSFASHDLRVNASRDRDRNLVLTATPLGSCYGVAPAVSAPMELHGQ